MSVKHKAMRVCVALALSTLCASPLAAATPEELLDQALDLFQEGQYQESQDVLQKIDRDELPADRKEQRDELAEEVMVAINQFRAAGNALKDADDAIENGVLDKAEQLLKSVLANTYATDEQKSHARQRIALIEKRRELEQKIASKQEDGEAPATQPATDGSDEANLEEARAQRTRVEAASIIASGEQALAAGQYDQAEKRFQEALKLVPNHPAALHGLELVRQHRQVEGKDNILSTTKSASRMRWTRTRRLYEQNVNEIRAEISDRNYDQARTILAETRQLLRAGREDASPPEDYARLSRHLDALAKKIDREQTDYRESQAMAQRIAANKAAIEREDRIQQERMQRITEIFDKADQLSEQREYEKAADLLREALLIDPTYKPARWKLDALEDANLIQKQANNRERFLNQVNEALLQADLARTPPVTGADDKVVAYPDRERWQMIANRDPFGEAGIGEETEADRIARQALETTLPPGPDLEFPDGATFGEIIDRLKEIVDVSINVNWGALSLYVIERESTVGEIDLGGMRVETALEILLDAVGGAAGAELGYDVLDGGIFISTEENLSQKTEVRVYPVSDLLLEIESISGTGGNMGMGGMGMMGGGMMGGGMGGYGGGMGGYGGGIGGGYGGGGYGGGGYGGGYGGGMMGGGMMGGGMMGGGYGGGYGQGGYGQNDDDESEEQREERITDLQDLIMKLVKPGTWEEDDTGTGEAIGSLSVWNDRLIVRHTRSAHREIRELFKQLRETKDQQVQVEARFITLTNNFLEEIGVDLDVVLNQGNAGLDRAVSPDPAGGQLFNPTLGSALLHSRRQTQLGFLPQAAAYGQPLAQTQSFGNPFTNTAVVPSGSPQNWWDRHTTPLPLINNTIGLAAPRATGIPGGLDGSSQPAFQMFGSFLDNIQVDFLLRATQLDARSSIVDAPRLTVYSGREASINIGTTINYVSQPGQLPVSGTGLSGNAASGRPPSISSAFDGRTFRVTPTVSGDKRYVTLELRPNFQQVEFENFADATGTLTLPRRTTTTIGTTVTVPDRGWLLLGGLKQSGETEIEAGVPALSKLPILKRAFTNRSRVKDERTLLLLVKPTIIIQGEMEDEAYPGLATSDADGT